MNLEPIVVYALKKCGMNKIVIALILCLTACQINQDQINDYQAKKTAKLNRVVSGQSIEVIVDNSLLKVRLKGVNTLDTWQREAKEKLTQLLTEKGTSPHQQKPVILGGDFSHKDRYGRISAYVWQNNVFINEQLIAEGYVLANLNYTDDQYKKRFRYAQDYARIMGYGLWHRQ